MPPRLFIRIEHKDSGRGMFGGMISSFPNIGQYPEFVVLQKKYDDLLPGAYRDHALGWRPEEGERWRFCFTGMKQLFKLLEQEDVVNLVIHGFIFYLYEATDYKESSHQAIFNINSVISKKDITSIFIKDYDKRIETSTESQGETTSQEPVTCKVETVSYSA